MPSRSGSGRGRPTERENRTIASCSPGSPSRRAARGAAGSPGTRNVARWTAPWGWTAFPRRAAATAARTPLTAQPAASEASRVADEDIPSGYPAGRLATAEAGAVPLETTRRRRHHGRVLTSATPVDRLLQVERIYAEPAAIELPRGREVLERFAGAELIEVPSHWRIPGLHGNEGNVADWNRIKRTELVLGTLK